MEKQQVKEMHSAYTPPFMLYMRFEVEILLKYFILNFYTSSIGTNDCLNCLPLVIHAAYWILFLIGCPAMA